MCVRLTRPFYCVVVTATEKGEGESLVQLFPESPEQKERRRNNGFRASGRSLGNDLFEGGNSGVHFAPPFSSSTLSCQGNEFFSLPPIAVQASVALGGQFKKEGGSN